jgi:hypothetical protein
MSHVLSVPRASAPDRARRNVEVEEAIIRLPHQEGAPGDRLCQHSAQRDGGAGRADRALAERRRRRCDSSHIRVNDFESSLEKRRLCPMPLHGSVLQTRSSRACLRSSSPETAVLSLIIVMAGEAVRCGMYCAADIKRAYATYRFGEDGPGKVRSASTSGSPDDRPTPNARQSQYDFARLRTHRPRC